MLPRIRNFDEFGIEDAKWKSCQTGLMAVIKNGILDIMKSDKNTFHEMAAKFKQGIVSMWETADQVAREKAVNALEAELDELYNIFGILVQGAFIGIPSPPMQISLDLLPLMEKEMTIMIEKIETANEPLSHLFSVFDVS